MADNLVICVARQFGSGGHEIGKQLATAMGIAFYDKELLKAAADKSGILEELFEKNDEKPASGLLHTPPMEMAGKMSSYADYMAYLPNDQMQNALAEVIHDAARESSCVIIGRCADYVLRGLPNMVSVFIHAPTEERIKRIAKKHNLDEDRARSLIRKTDRSRANYYSYYTDRDWGRADNYDLVLDAGRLGTEKAALLLKEAIPQFIV
ncbi:cytidylate kinase-like family protein [Ruminococcaceae bacterium OttesenSCG-928-D13]|nr:cytidylate kinase-like family protein [Ruminococcaceae bacterium OttesenSCG-928-D13]